MDNSGNVFRPIVDTSRLSVIDRDETMEVLLEVEKIVKEEEETASELKQLDLKKRQLLAEAEELRNTVSKEGKRTIWIVTIVSGVLGLLIGGFLCIVTAGIAYVIMQFTVKKADLKKHSEENNYNAEVFLAENLDPVQNRIYEVEEQQRVFFESGKKEWATDVVGPELYNSKDVQMLYNLIKNRRADNLKEAFNKYDDSRHKNQMEEMQRAIQNAAEITAAESVKQTAYAKSTEENTHRAATASQATAYHTRQIMRNQ